MYLQRELLLPDWDYDDCGVHSLSNKQPAANSGLYGVHLQSRLLPSPERNCCDDDGLRGLPGGNILCRRRIILHKLRCWLLHGCGGDGRNELHIVHCRHIQHRRDEHGLHNLPCQQLPEHGGHGRDELHGLPDEQCGVCGSDELLL